MNSKVIEIPTERFRQQFLNGEFTEEFEPLINPISEKEYNEKNAEKDSQAVKQFVKTNLFKDFNKIKHLP